MGRAAQGEAKAGQGSLWQTQATQAVALRALPLPPLHRCCRGAPAIVQAMTPQPLLNPALSPLQDALDRASEALRRGALKASPIPPALLVGSWSQQPASAIASGLVRASA